MDNNLNKEVSSGVVWNYLERILAQAVSLVVTIVLSRLIAPDHFGAISIVTIMITLCNIFISNGFANALIQAKEADKPAFTAMFYYGLLASGLLYLCIYLCAPLVAKYYNLEILTPVIRIMGLRVPIASLNSVQHAYLVRRMEFKKFFVTTFFGTFISAFVGIYMAYHGFEIWALVGQYLTNVTIDTILLYFTCGWRPGLSAAWKKSLKLLPFGLKMLAAALIKNIYSEMSGLIVGKKFSVTDLAYYTKGKQFPSIVVTNLNSSIARALFSAMSKYQDEKERIKSMLRRSLKLNLYIVGPLMVGMAVCSTSIISVLLTDKWLESTSYLQIFCVIFLIKSMQNTFLQALNSIGKSGITLRIEVISTAFGCSALALSIFVFNSILSVVLSILVEQLLSLLLCSVACKKLLAFPIFEQIKDVAKIALAIVIMGAIVFAIGLLIQSVYIKLALQVLVGISLYITLSKLMKIESFDYLIAILKNLLFKRKKRVS